MPDGIADFSLGDFVDVLFLSSHYAMTVKEALRITASITFLFRACLNGVLDTIALLSRAPQAV